MRTHIAAGSATPIYKALVNLCKKLLNFSLGPCITLEYDSITFPGS